MTDKPAQTLRLILGDQLNARHSWLQSTDDNVVYVLAEIRQETDYVRHHIQKLSAFFAAMAQFASQLENEGHRVCYLDLDATADFDSLPELIAALCQRYSVNTFEYQRPDEYRLLEQLRQLPLTKVQINEVDSEHFLLPFAEISEQFVAGKAQRMEAFYRRMRRRFAILMEGDEPVSGRWNYDRENREKLKEADIAKLPVPLVFSNDVRAILERIKKHKVKYFGEETTLLPWPIDRQQALQLLTHFCQYCLPNFGRFQDSMTDQTPHAWSLYHSRLSFAINSKMLSPREVIDTAISRFETNGNIELAQLEGFVRQILGWREFVRGIYWANMPNYARSNFLRGQRDLPGYFWNGKTNMRCMQQSLGQSLDYAYAHHIQRLMVIGNFSLLTGLHPDAVDAWYLGVYVDALEWVEMPNTRGMALFADGGIVGSKPYAAGGNYIRKMSDYCNNCYYKVTTKTGSRACPFNSLYWHFMISHRNELARNQRLRMLYVSWDKMAVTQQQAIIDTATHYLETLESL